MKLLRFGVITITTFIISVSTIQAQTADEIINKYVDAIGGKDVLTKIKSVYFEGTATVMGNDYPTKTTILAGKGIKTETDVNGSDIIQCVTDTSGWSVNPMAGQATPTALPADVVKKGKSAFGTLKKVICYLPGI